MYSPEKILEVLSAIEKEVPAYEGMTFSARQYFFVDPMIPYDNGKPGLGNKLAFEMFIQRSRRGYYVSMDGNDFKLINKKSHLLGDLGIKNIGKALRNATMPILEHSKLFRSGGDEFLFYCEKVEVMIAFLENVIKELDQLELIDGTHKLTLSFGLGLTYENAELALSEAKNKKVVGKSENMIHSIL
jgi:GGDEF domain-containing protein